MAKLGPFCSKDNCWSVRGVLDKLMTHLSALHLHVCGLLEVGSPWLELEAAVVVEGGGGLGVAGTLGLLELGLEGWMNTDGTFRCPLKPLFSQSMLSKIWECLLRL